MVNMDTIKQGLYPDITNEAYHAGLGISKSDLDLIHRSPAHYKAAKENPQQPTPAMILGTAVHSAVLEPDVFERLYVTAPEVDRRSKAGREEYAAFEFDAAQNHKLILSADNYKTCMGIRDAVYANNLAAKALYSPGKSECSVFWDIEPMADDPFNNKTMILCKCRPDRLRDDGIIVDVKSIEDARADSFRQAVARYRYHVQAAYFSDGVTAAVMPVRGFIFIAIEKQPPYGVATYMLDPEALKIGRMTYEADINTFVNCTTSNTWPCYPEEVQTLDLPKWAA